MSRVSTVRRTPTRCCRPLGAQLRGREVLTSPQTVRDFLRVKLGALEHEVFAVLMLDAQNRRVVWPDSKTGGMSKPLSEEAYRLLSTAARQDGSLHVFPSPNHPGQHMTTGEYYGGWTRILKRAGVSHVGTHGIRHRSATDIANSGIPVKVGMALTAHKTVAMFMRYVHTEDRPVREAAELVANRRKTITGVESAKSVEAVVGA